MSEQEKFEGLSRRIMGGRDKTALEAFYYLLCAVGERKKKGGWEKRVEGELKQGKLENDDYRNRRNERKRQS